MTADEEAFLAAIEEAPDDYAPHGVFADWLDEHDRPEEADWHRAWTTAGARAAHEWFRQLASEHLNNYKDNPVIPPEELIQAGREWLATTDSKWGSEYYTQDGGQSLQDFMYDESNRRDFWQNWSLATGTYVPATVAEDGYVFSCTC